MACRILLSCTYNAYRMLAHILAFPTCLNPSEPRPNLSPLCRRRVWPRAPGRALRDRGNLRRHRAPRAASAPQTSHPRLAALAVSPAASPPPERSLSPSADLAGAPRGAAGRGAPDAAGTASVPPRWAPIPGKQARRARLLRPRAGRGKCAAFRNGCTRR